MLRRFAILALLASAIVASSCETRPEAINQFVAAHNRLRAEAGVRPLRANVHLNVRADAWAATMRDDWVAKGCPTEFGPALRHSSLSIQYSPDAVGDWSKLGENVGAVSTPTESPDSPRQLMDAYMASPHHRENVLDPAWTQIGVGDVSGPTAEQKAAGSCPNAPTGSYTWNAVVFWG